MTSTTLAYRPAPRFPWLLLFAVALLAAVIFGAHAVAKHGSEALAVRQACDQRGHYQLWQALERPNKFYRVCDLGGGRFGLQIVECTARGIRERSSFIPGASQHPAGSYGRIYEYLTGKAVRVAGGFCQ